jgi:hypothetical protein
VDCPVDLCVGKDYRSFLAYALADAANRNTTPPMNYEYANYMQAGAGMRHGTNKEAMVRCWPVGRSMDTT